MIAFRYISLKISCKQYANPEGVRDIFVLFPFSALGDRGDLLLGGSSYVLFAAAAYITCNATMREKLPVNGCRKLHHDALVGSLVNIADFKLPASSLKLYTIFIAA